MKTCFTLAVLFFTGAGFACNDHLYRLALNQRSFYNPASLCPYCKGSTFFSLGAGVLPSQNSSGYFFAFGNDNGENQLHGPWDISCSRSATGNETVSSASLRYAWMHKFGDWRFAGGFRASYFRLEQDIVLPENPVARQRLYATVRDADAGLMLTNTKGFYAGFSVMHVFRPQKEAVQQNGAVVSVGMQRNYVVMTGDVFPLSKHFDLMADANAMYDGSELIAQPGLMIRADHRIALGGGVMLSQYEKSEFEIRGGYTSSTFKWLGTVAFTNLGVEMETGVVMRFGVGWHGAIPVIRPISDPCVGGVCTANPPQQPKKKKKKGDSSEFAPHQ